MAIKYLGGAVNHKKELSIKSETERLRNHILPVFGNKKVDALTTRDISVFLNSLINKEHKYPRLKSINGVSVKRFSEQDFIKVFIDCGVNLKDIYYDLENIQDPADLVLAQYIDDNELCSYMKKMHSIII